MVRRYTSGLITTDTRAPNIYITSLNKLYTVTEALQYIYANIWPSQGYANVTPEFLQLLIVGGGGGGNNGQPGIGGGGGAGGLLDITFTKLFSGYTFTATIGAGGAASANGNPTVLATSGFNLIASGGGSGGATLGGVYGNQYGIPGGSGGGAAGSGPGINSGSGNIIQTSKIQEFPLYGVFGYTTQGNNGGNGGSGAGGGGGWATIGQDGAPAANLKSGGDGGLGYRTNILGYSNVFCAGGGGGSTSFPTWPFAGPGQAGSSEGGGSGGVKGTDAYSANTFGSGGGGGGLAAPIGSYPNQDGFRAGAGSPGVVIFRFSNTSLFNALTVSAPGATVIRYPGNVVYRFASAGSISW